MFLSGDEIYLQIITKLNRNKIIIMKRKILRTTQWQLSKESEMEKKPFVVVTNDTHLEKK